MTISEGSFLYIDISLLVVYLKYFLLIVCMKLYEFEGKELFKRVGGINVPKSILIGSADDLPQGLLAVKAQLLSGKRGKGGTVKICASHEEVEKAVKDILGKKTNNEEIKKILLEEKLDIKKEYYMSVTYDTRSRAPVAILCASGGMDIEEFKEKNPGKVLVEPVDLTADFDLKTAKNIVKKAGLPEKSAEILLKLFNCFKSFDCRVAEINPLIETKSGELFAADSKVVLDDDAMFRHTDLTFQPRTAGGRQLTQLEADAKEIDKQDHRGTAGSSFIELGGDIAILASGGGASITCVDALIAYGGRPANYVEYSGNPPKSKVKRLTEITLSKPGLKGCWIVGGRANFTDIYETLKGVAEALVEINPKYPIVVRRAGPRDKEAFEMFKELAKKHKWNLLAFGDEMPMTETAKILLDEIRKVNGGKY